MGARLVMGTGRKTLVCRMQSGRRHELSRALHHEDKFPVLGAPIVAQDDESCALQQCPMLDEGLRPNWHVRISVHPRLWSGQQRLWDRGGANGCPSCVEMLALSECFLTPQSSKRARSPSRKAADDIVKGDPRCCCMVIVSSSLASSRCKVSHCAPISALRSCACARALSDHSICCLIVMPAHMTPCRVKQRFANLFIDASYPERTSSFRPL